ncbi:DUF1289 domain-containing protein [Roseomonas sp. CCTCC AB2023176]|uniref:DUF1289 domain-containing protein n=1 Tax=Roseomonas sp. CCTCC AB2023176 TaxID=3342640 RepID=UPI0035DCCFB3
MATPSPCCGICALDASGTFCTARGRTLDEIAAWPDATEVRRAAIAAVTAARTGRGVPSPPGSTLTFRKVRRMSRPR